MVHWPLLSLYSNMRPADISIIAKIILIVISLIIAYIIYKVVELPIKKIPRKLRLPFALLLTIALILTGVFAFFEKSKLPTSSQNIRQVASSESLVVQRNSWYFTGASQRDQPEINSNCAFNSQSDLVFSCAAGSSWDDIDALVVGDSKAEILFKALIRSNGKLNWGFIGGGANPVVPLLRAEYSPIENSLTSDSLPSYLSKQKKIKKIVVVSATRNLFELENDYSLLDLGEYSDLGLVTLQFKKWLYPILESKKSIIIVRDNPTLRDPTYCRGIYSAFSFLDSFVQKDTNIKGCFYSYKAFQSDSSVYRSLLKSVSDSEPFIEVMDFTDYFCNKGRGRCELFRNDRLLYSFTDHISDLAADFEADAINESVEGK